MGDILQHFPHLLAEWGYLAVFGAIIADSLGVPIPGEVMLIFAAVYAGATHHLLLPLVIAAAVCGAVVGDNLTYALGRFGGYPLLQRHGQMFHLGERRLTIGHYLFWRYGGGVVWLGRMIPVLHIWTAVLAGVNRMPWIRFALTNAAGAVVWATGLGLIGFVMGREALRLGGFIAAVGIPLALLIGGSVLVLLRVNERRLYASAQRHLPADEPERQRGFRNGAA